MIMKWDDAFGDCQHLALVNTQEMESAIIIDVLLPWSSQVPT
jgi:hypothetical protein